jgi:hypothetical protein
LEIAVWTVATSTIGRMPTVMLAFSGGPAAVLGAVLGAELAALAAGLPAAALGAAVAAVGEPAAELALGLVPPPHAPIRTITTRPVANRRILGFIDSSFDPGMGTRTYTMHQGGGTITPRRRSA